MRKIALPLIGIGMLASVGPAAAQSNPYVGHIMTVAFAFCPFGWVEMDGRLLSIVEYETLFTLIGTNYGGDGQETFAVPKAPAEYLANGTQLRQCISLFGYFPIPHP